MNFGLTPEQELLRTNARAFLEKECPSAVVRQVVKDPIGDIPGLWQKMADLGWMGLLIPEEIGGLDLTMFGPVVVLQGVGRGFIPRPYFLTLVLGGLTPLHL